MKTKDEILKMSKEELGSYKWSDDLDKKGSDCSDCSYCSDCFDCSYCSYCRNIKHQKFMICNVQLTEEEYKKKVKERKDGS